MNECLRVVEEADRGLVQETVVQTPLGTFGELQTVSS